MHVWVLQYCFSNSDILSVIIINHQQMNKSPMSHRNGDNKQKERGRINSHEKPDSLWSYNMSGPSLHHRHQRCCCTSSEEDGGTLVIHGNRRVVSHQQLFLLSARLPFRRRARASPARRRGRRALITDAQRGPMAVAPAAGHLGASMTPTLSKNKKMKKWKWGHN